MPKFVRKVEGPPNKASKDLSHVQNTNSIAFKVNSLLIHPCITHRHPGLSRKPSHKSSSIVSKQFEMSNILHFAMRP